MMLTGPANGRARVIYVNRSDGRPYASEEVHARKSPATKQVGEPIPEDIMQLDDEDTIEELHRWKILVGTGLADEMAWPRDSQYHLVFPDGFALRWHNFDSDDSELRMYGHPAGCSDDFLYKEPYEFVPHVLWLLSDSEDRKICPCKPCHRATGRKVPRSLVERLQADVAAKQAAAQAPAPAPAPAADTKPRKTAAPKTAAAKPKKTAIAATEAGAKAPAKEPAPAKPTKRAAASKVAPTSVAQPAIPAPTPVATANTVPPSAAPASAIPANFLINNEPTLFRRGEMVWYQQEPAWRIGIIRQVGAAPTHAYTIIPLGHSLLRMPDLVKQQGQMRPFLTFSVPSVGVETLQNQIFSEVQWPELINTYGARSELIALEASKMAAVEIDSSWSVFNQLPAEPTQPKNQTRFDGVFLGAEMIRRGDPIRSKDKSRGTLLEVAEIIVTSTTSVPTPGAPTAPPTTKDLLTFRGVEFETSLVPESTHVAKQPQGAIFAKDTAFRSAAAKAGGANQKCMWTIKSWDATWQEREVAGRSYVTDELINVTSGAAAVQQALQTGKFTEAQAFLNNRMQNAAARNMPRRPNRRLTIGHAVSQAQPLKLGEGIYEDQ